MELDWPNIIFRGGVIVMGVLFIIKQARYHIMNWPYMSPAFTIRSYAFMGFAFSAIWGVSELYSMHVPLGPRNVILFFVMALATVAVFLPDKYQQFPGRTKENEK